RAAEVGTHEMVRECAGRKKKDVIRRVVPTLTTLIPRIRWESYSGFGLPARGGLALRPGFAPPGSLIRVKANESAGGRSRQKTWAQCSNRSDIVSERGRGLRRVSSGAS